MKRTRSFMQIPAVAGLVFLLPLPAPAAQSKGQADASSVSSADTSMQDTPEVPAEIRNCRFSERGAFIGAFSVRHARIGANVDRLRTSYIDALASPGKKAAMSELDAAESAFEEKLGAVDSVTSETWAAARDNVCASWDDLKSAFRKARDAR